MRGTEPFWLILAVLMLIFGAVQSHIGHMDKAIYDVLVAIAFLICSEVATK